MRIEILLHSWLAVCSEPTGTLTTPSTMCSLRRWLRAMVIPSTAFPNATTFTFLTEEEEEVVNEEVVEVVEEEEEEEEEYNTIYRK